ncbi:putative RNA-binding Zn ribbon-like protein [Hamadaea flava]|uniref:CGNR zinc finger domain-containing protein n=1 Tax=Hamadaea flava TaxID=1742688 RepID=A0ABV8LPK6_9ACTN|nr:CGNR zinc finger domain-containing protein [Hamadaea flava]MCP2322467.1 putative RNA-binding Zn ribbon-like protein [Hamadaea flava]
MPVMVDGLRMPAIVAGDVALEICNTRAAWDGGAETHEYLHSYEHVAVWARHAGLLPDLATADPADGDRVLARVLEFRRAYYQALTGADADWSLISHYVRTLAPGLRPAAETGSESAAAWDYGDDAERPLRAIVHQAARLLASPGSTEVRACAGAGCGWLFRDPRGRRRWCVMAVCGNRAKVARHAATHRPAA